MILERDTGTPVSRFAVGAGRLHEEAGQLQILENPLTGVAVRVTTDKAVA
jgi:hypothetical protein